MKKFIVIVAKTTDNKIAKYQDFDTDAEAITHLAFVLPNYPEAFVFENEKKVWFPENGAEAMYPEYVQEHTIVDMQAKTIVFDNATVSLNGKSRDWRADIETASQKLPRSREDHIKDVLNGVAQDAVEQSRYDAKIKIRGERP